MELVFNPGPTKVHPEISEWLVEAASLGVTSKHHRSQWFKELFFETQEKLKELAKLSDDFRMFVYGCASEIWERALESIAVHPFFLVLGEFSNKWHFCAQKMGFTTKAHRSDHTYSEALGNLPSEGCDTFCLVHGETSIGLNLKSQDLTDFMTQNRSRYFILDVVSTFPIASFDYSLADVLLFSVQKCFCLPAGLGVCLVNGRAIERATKVHDSRPTSGFASFYFESLFNEQKMTPATPNVLAIWLLNKAVSKYLREGLSKLRSLTNQKARLVHDKLTSLGFEPFVSSPDYRSNTVLTFVSPVDVDKLRDILRTRGIQVGSGFGVWASKVIRIANFPSHTEEDFFVLFKQIERAVLELKK
jgi:phosphoserine aminotransferase